MLCWWSRDILQYGPLRGLPDHLLSQGRPVAPLPREACAGGHHWCREIRKLGQDVRLKAPEHIKPVVNRQKNDAIDAEAIAKAASLPTMEVFTVPLHLPCG